MQLSQHLQSLRPLLPAFVGLHAITQAQAKGVKIYGATLHQADENLDTGQIIAQVADIWPEGHSLKFVQHMSYYQKVWLSLVWVERCIFGVSDRTQCPKGLPGLTLSSIGLYDGHLLKTFYDWLLEEEVLWSRKE
jgi:hypothetical protein